MFARLYNRDSTKKAFTSITKAIKKLYANEIENRVKFLHAMPSRYMSEDYAPDFFFFAKTTPQFCCEVYPPQFFCEDTPQFLLRRLPRNFAAKTTSQFRCEDTPQFLLRRLPRNFLRELLRNIFAKLTFVSFRRY